MYVSNTAVAYISGTKLIANSTGSTTLTLNRPDGKIPLQIPVQVTGTNNSSNTYSYYIPNASVGTIVDQIYTGYDIRPSVSVWLNGGYLYEEEIIPLLTATTAISVLHPLQLTESEIIMEAGRFISVS